ncbi:MAG: DUF4126 domain-containing protein [Mariprofundaceae bacterium]|nr:DUF4126 domain-containing protein [Mariprofundaceae bacterium]
MDAFNELSNTLALSMGAAWASGINLYAAVLMLGLMGSMGYMELPSSLQVLQDPLVIGAAGLMYAVEFFADKIPGVDTAWDAIHSFVRIPAGAMLAAASLGDVDPAMAITAGILGGGLTAATHATKAGSRVLINTSPEPFSNWTASVGEDVAVFGGLWAAIHYPLLFSSLLILFILLMVWLLPRLWLSIQTIARRIGRFFRHA